MAVYCSRCGAQRQFPASAVRSSRAPCDFCGGFDQIMLTRSGKEIRTQNLPNYSYPNNLLPTVVEREEEGTEAGS